MTGPRRAAAPDAVLQSRGVGVGEAVREVLPAWAVDAFAVATRLGDAWLLLTLVAVVYLAYDRRAGGFVGGTLFAGFAVVIALKAAFALPRPPADLQSITVTGYGFPSGHAVAATVGWGALAVALDRVWTARQRAAFAGAVVVLVASSRVVIGVHYLVDVLAGVWIGLVVLGVAVVWGRDEPLGLFGVAGGLAGAAVVVSGTAVEAVALLGACAGAIAAWQVVEPADRPWGRTGIVAAAGAGVLLLAIVAAAAPVVSLVFGAGAAATAGVFLAPVAAARWPG